MEKKLSLLWSAIHREDEAGVVGIHGTAGVGKSRLLRQLREKLQRRHKGDQVEDREARHFDVVLTVEASEEWTERSVLEDIARQLGIVAASDDIDVPRSLAVAVRAALETQSFVIVLDGLWEPVSLESVGIPDPASGRGGSRKVVVSSRIKHVLTQMGAATVYPLDVLSESDSWDMFVAAAGKDLDEDQGLREAAENLVKKLGGTPLALQSVGQAMSSERSLAAWEKASTDMDTAPWDVPGMKPVLESLKRTYDNLRLPTTQADGDRKTALLQSCVEYISQYSRRFSTNRSTWIDYWVGEGLIDGFDTLEEAVAVGEHLIDTLIGSGMVGEGYFRTVEFAVVADVIIAMEGYWFLTKSNWEVLRGDVATPTGPAVKLNDPAFAMIVWIRSLKGKRWCMKPCGMLCAAPPREEWEAADTVSLMFNDIQKLPSEELHCPELTWLILWRNLYLRKIPDGFFRYMPNLRMLELGGIAVKTLPPSIGDLRGLLYLDLQSMRHLRSLPKELGNLIKLRFLILNSTRLTFVPKGVFSKLQDLQVLRMTWSYGWENGPLTAEFVDESDLGSDDDEGKELIVQEGQEIVDESHEEFEGQEIVDDKDLAGESDKEIEGHEIVDDKDLAGESNEGVEGQGVVDEFDEEVEGQETVDGKDTVSESDKGLEGQEIGESDEKLEVEGQEIPDDHALSDGELPGQQIVEDSDMAGVEELTGLKKLKQLDTDLFTVKSLRTLFSSPCTEEAVRSLRLSYVMDSLELDLVADMGYTTTGPASLQIINCEELERLALGGSDANPEGKTYLDRLTSLTLYSVQLITSIECSPSTCLANLRELIIVECYTLQETLFGGTWNEEEAVERGKPPIALFPRLEVLRLKRLLNLKSISKGRRLQFPALTTLKVKQCPKLTDLAFSEDTGLKMEKIKGSRKWWNALKWSDDKLKTRFEPFFEEGGEPKNNYFWELPARYYVDQANEKKLAK